MDVSRDGHASAYAAVGRCVQGHGRPTPALAEPDIGRKPPGKRRGAGSRIGERDLLAASGEQSDDNNSGHGSDMAHVFQGCATFGTDKGLNAAVEGDRHAVAPNTTSRASRFRTVVACQSPPRAVRTPRAFNAAAIARCPFTPRDTALTAFTDGCPGLRGILADAGVLEPPILDWFHIAMRLQHLKQIGDGLAAGDPARAAAKAVIVTEVERLHWRIWNGKAKNAGKSIDRIRVVMHHFRGERDSRKSIAPSRKLWTALRALNRYLIGQSAWLVNYAERHRAGLRVGTAITEGTANFLVNRRMNKSQQMRWSRRGADLLLQVRCAVYNGTLGAEFGQKFHPANDSFPPIAVAA